MKWLKRYIQLQYTITKKTNKSYEGSRNILNLEKANGSWDGGKGLQFQWTSTGKDHPKSCLMETHCWWRMLHPGVKGDDNDEMVPWILILHIIGTVRIFEVLTKLDPCLNVDAQILAVPAVCWSNVFEMLICSQLPNCKNKGARARQKYGSSLISPGLAFTMCIPSYL